MKCIARTQNIQLQNGYVRSSEVQHKRSHNNECFKCEGLQNIRG